MRKKNCFNINYFILAGLDKVESRSYIVWWGKVGRYFVESTRRFQPRCLKLYTHIEVVHLPLRNCLRDFFPFFQTWELSHFQYNYNKIINLICVINSHGFALRSSYLIYFKLHCKPSNIVWRTCCATWPLYCTL